jgi:hypothetical protein
MARPKPSLAPTANQKNDGFCRQKYGFVQGRYNQENMDFMTLWTLVHTEWRDTV